MKDKKADAAQRYYVRANLLVIVLPMLVVVAAITVWRPTRAHVAGLVLIAALTLLNLFVTQVSARTFGFGMLAVAGLLTVFAEIARPDWGIEPYELGIAAVSTGAIAMSLVFTNKKTGEADARFENVAGIVVLFGLLATVALVAWRGAPSLTHPASLVALEMLAAMADLAGERWTRTLALAAILPIAVLVADYIRPKWGRPTFVFFRAHTHSWMAWPMLFGGLNSLLVSVSRKRTCRVALLRCSGIVTAVWGVLFLVDAGLQRLSEWPGK